MIQKSSVCEVRDCTGLHPPCNNETKCVEDIDLGQCRYITLKLIHCGKWNCNDHLQVNKPAYERIRTARDHECVLFKNFHGGLLWSEWQV